MLWLPRRMFGAMVPTEDSETPNRIRVRQLTDKLAMLQDELDNEKEVTLFSHCDADAPTTVILVDPRAAGSVRSERPLAIAARCQLRHEATRWGWLALMATVETGEAAGRGSGGDDQNHHSSDLTPSLALFAPRSAAAPVKDCGGLGLVC